jgi:hypothetical protein
MRLIFLGMLLIGLLTTASYATLAEQIVAVVNGQLIFETDILRNQTFFSEEGSDVETRINHKLLLIEAKRFVLTPPEESEVDLMFAGIRQKFSNPSAFENALKETGFMLDDFKREILNRLWVKKLIQDRITFFIFITDAEVRQYYQNHQSDFGGKTVGDVEDTIRAILEKEKEGMKVKEYIARIKSQAKITVNAR